MNIRISHDIPAAADYVNLRLVCGLSRKNLAASEIGLKNSIFLVTLWAQERLVGMGRLIGDGGCFFQVCDIAVHPDYQGRGFGKQIMAAITDYMDNNLPKNSYVSLIADLPADQLYAQFGFEPTAPDSIGMCKYYR